MLQILFYQVSTSKEKDEDLEAEMRKQYLEQKRNKKLEKIVEMHDKTKRSESLLKIHQIEMKNKVILHFILFCPLS